MCAAALAAMFAASVAAVIAAAAAAAAVDAVKDVISGVRTAGVNSLAAPAPGRAEGVTPEGEFSPAPSVDVVTNVGGGVGLRLLTALRPA